MEGSGSRYSHSFLHLEAEASRAKPRWPVAWLPSRATAQHRSTVLREACEGKLPQGPLKGYKEPAYTGS